MATLISRPKSSEQTNPWRRQPPVFNLFIHRLQLPITPISSNHGCDESRQTPTRIKRAAMKLPVALAASPPQKNVGAATRPMGSSHTCGCRSLGADPWLAHVAGDPRLLEIGDGGTTSHSDQMAVAPVPKSGLAGRRRDSCKAVRHVKRFAFLQNVEAGSCQLVRQRLDRQHVVGLRLLPFLEPLGFSAIAQGKVGCLNERPGQVLVAVLGCRR